jgi:hypothetical protein
MALGALQLRKLLPYLGLLPAWLVLALIAWFRLPEITRQTVWAEDGGVFLRDILASGVWETLATPYDGYLHVIPRALIGIAYTIAPIESFAVSVSFLSCAAVAGVGLAAFFLAKPVIQPPWLRAILVVIPILLPVAPVEVLGNAANVHWYLLWLAPWLLVREPVSPSGRAGFFLVALATAASEVITGLFLPLALWMMWKRHNYWAPLGLIIGVGLQLLTTLFSPRAASLRVENSVEFLSVLIGFFVQPIGSLWRADSRALAADLVEYGGLAVLLPAVLLALLCVAIFMFGRTVWKVAAAYAVGSAGACWAASVLVNAHPMFNYTQFDSQDWQESFQYSRYAAAPGMLLLTLVPLALASLASRFPRKSQCGTRRQSAAALLVFTLVMLTNFFPARTLREDGPEWSAGVRNARAACNSDVTMADSAVTAAPALWKFAQVRVPCAVLAAPQAGGLAAAEDSLDRWPPR